MVTLLPQAIKKLCRLNKTSRSLERKSLGPLISCECAALFLAGLKQAESFHQKLLWD